MVPINSNSPLRQQFVWIHTLDSVAEGNGGFVRWNDCAGHGCRRMFVPDNSHIHRARLNRNSSGCVSQKKGQSQCSQLSSDINGVRRGKTALSEKLNSIRLFVLLVPWMSDICINSSCNGRHLINLQRASTHPAAEGTYESFREKKEKKGSFGTTAKLYLFMGWRQ